MSLERPWLDNYPSGVPAGIDIDAYPSIVAVLDRATIDYRDRPAFTNFGKSLSYADIDRLSRQFAAYLLGELKLKKGDRVAFAAQFHRRRSDPGRNIAISQEHSRGELPRALLVQPVIADEIVGEHVGHLARIAGIDGFLHGLDAVANRLFRRCARTTRGEHEQERQCQKGLRLRDSMLQCGKHVFSPCQGTDPMLKS